MKKEQIQNLAKEFCEAKGYAKVFTDRFVSFLQSMIDQGHVTEAPFNSDVNESCERAKWLMENRLFDSEEYGEHPDVCELYEIIEDLQKSVKPIESTVSSAGKITDEELSKELFGLMITRTPTIEIVKWMRDKMKGDIYNG